jgi:alpha-mannosidase
VRQWTFGFRLNAPETWHEEVGAILKAKLKTEGGHYATTNALYQYLTLNHFVSVNENGYGITLSNRDCYFMQLGNSTHTFLDASSPIVHVLAGGRVSNPELGIANQDGEREFTQCFSIRTHGAFDKVSEMKFALEHQNPFVVGTVTGDAGILPETEYSLLKVSDAHVLVWSIKPAEEGYGRRGIIIRSWNLGEQALTATVITSGTLAEAYETSHVETDVRPVSFSGHEVQTAIPPQGMATYRIKFR